jgi:hypothetical protein
MADEIDVWRVANQLLVAKGEAAEAEVEQHRPHCKPRKMPEGVAFCRRVAAAVQEL